VSDTPDASNHMDPPAARPARDDEQPISGGDTAWSDYWAARGTPWRTEPEVDAQRQRFLADCRTRRPSWQLDGFPFGGIRLARADIEWLLATHEDQGVVGPVVQNWVDEVPASLCEAGGEGEDGLGAPLAGADLQSVAMDLLLRGMQWASGQHEAPKEGGEEGGEDDPQLTRWGLDLRGAQLDGEDLSALPLDSTWGGLDKDRWRRATTEQRDAAALHLEGADLHDVWLRQARLRRAHLQRANLRGAHLTDADLREARLEAADLSGARGMRVSLFRADLHGALLRGANLKQAELVNADLRGADLRGAILWGATLRGAHLEGALLQGVNLQRAALPGATLIGANLAGADLRGASLMRAKLEGANLEGAKLDGANLTQVQGL
jgi:uncharacterized protein YjbI with pentapeptide repeats